MARPDGYGATSLDGRGTNLGQPQQNKQWMRKLLGMCGLVIASVSIVALSSTSVKHDDEQSVELSQLAPETTTLARSHSGWSGDHLRNEVLRIAKLLDAANAYEKKQEDWENREQEVIATMLAKNISQMLAIHEAIRADAAKIKDDFAEDSAELQDRTKESMKLQAAEEEREDRHARDVMRILMTHKGEINWDALLAKARLDHINAYTGKTVHHEKVVVDRINKEEAKGTKEVEKHIEDLLARVRRNESKIKDTDSFLRKREDEVDHEESSSYAKSLRDVQAQEREMGQHRTDIIDMSAEIDQVGDGITHMQDDLKKFTAGTTQVETRSSELEKSVTSVHNKIKDELSAAEEHIEKIRGNLADLVSLTAQVQSELKSETAAHSRMAAAEEVNMGKMKAAVKDMEPQLNKILSLNGDVSSLQGQVETKLQAFEKKFQGIKTKQEGLDETSSKVSDGIKDAMEKVGKLEEQDDSGDIKAGYKDLMETLEPVGSELILVEGLREEVAALGGKLDRRVSALKADASKLLNERAAWEAYIAGEHKKLHTEMEAQIQGEQKRMAEVQVGLLGMGKAVNESKAFKERVAQVLGQLKSELKDTSQSLLVLDTKYTAQMDDVSKQIQELKDLQGDVANPDLMSEGADRVEVRAEGVLNSLDDMKEEIKRSRDRQKALAARQVELKKRLQEVTKHLGSAITLANNHLERHPDLIERISCTCYDGFKLEGVCIAGSMLDTSTCDPCPAGSYCTRGTELECKATCPSGQELKGECPAGSSADTTTCEECPAGVFCDGGTRAPCKVTCDVGELLRGDCPPGSVSDTTACDPCPAGFYCGDGEATECKTTCPDGQLLTGVCKEGSTADDTKCEPCPEGHFCMDGEAIPCATTCQDGKVLKGSCPPGSTSDATSCEECASGFFCQGGEAHECTTTCEPGLVLEGECAPSSKRDTVKCKTCPRDMFCVDGVAHACKTTCDAGQQLIGECRRGSGADLTECIPCPAGHYCMGGELDECREKCLNGKELVGDCPVGSSEDTSACEPCPVGFYCRDGFPKKECKTTCPPGKLLEGACEEGSKRDVIRCTWCDRGFYCQEGVAHACKTECGDGKILTGKCGKASSEDTTLCEPCPGGKYCAGGEIKDCKTTCPDGEFLDGFCAPGSTEDTTQCKKCPEGSFCKDGRKMECVSSCEPGQKLEGKCVAGSTEQVTRCVPCPPGYYCGGTDGKALECTSSCIDGKQLRGECLGGAERDDVECVPCPEGLYCQGGHTMECKTSCEPGKILLGKCSEGSLQDTTSCSPCPEGSFCTDGVTHRCKTTCDPGLQLNGHCSLGSVKDVTTCDPCPAGFWCRAGRPYACTSQCPDGQTVKGECKEGSTEDLPCIACQAGNYCAAGKTTACKETCVDGKELVGFCVAGSSRDTSDCHDCPAGSWCTGGEARLCRMECGPGQELLGSCQSGSAVDTTTCEECGAGFYCQDGKKFPCRGTCPNGKILTEHCLSGAKDDVNMCDPCPEGSFCSEGKAFPCKTTCPDGLLLSGSCGVGSVADTTVCGPCPAGSYCVGNTVHPCKTTCEDGKELVGFCSAGLSEDNTQCDPCPAASFCKDGIATPCRSTCPAGEVFGGACAAGSAADTTTCNECEAGFFCQHGIQAPCKTECSSPLAEPEGECPAGSVEDTVECVSSGTPPPMPVKWWSYRSDYKGTAPPPGEPHGVSMLRLTSGTSGYLQGSMPLPVPGASWTVQFYIGWPMYDAGPMNEGGFPTQNVGEPGSDTVKVSINGKEQTFSTSPEYRGKMQVVMETIEADAVIYKFDFTSSTTDPALHPFVSAGEVTLNHDAETGPDGEGIDSGGGEFKGKAINAIDGKTVKPGADQHDGYEKRVMTVEEEVTLLLFQDTKLITKVPMEKGKWRMRNIATGKYACMGVAKGFNAFFSPDCEVADGVLFMYAVFSPWLRPGESRTVLTWGEKPRDMDSYMLVPHKEGLEEPCEVSWVNLECHSGAVEIDYDQKSGYGPETITILAFREGKYRFRVSEYRGLEDNKEVLLNSHAQVTVFTESSGARFSVKKDGFIKGRDWYVFTIDGATRRILPCTEETCGHGYHDAKGLGNGA